MTTGNTPSTPTPSAIVRARDVAAGLWRWRGVRIWLGAGAAAILIAFGAAAFTRPTGSDSLTAAIVADKATAREEAGDADDIRLKSAELKALEARIAAAERRLAALDGAPGAEPAALSPKPVRAAAGPNASAAPAEVARRSDASAGGLDDLSSADDVADDSVSADGDASGDRLAALTPAPDPADAQGLEPARSEGVRVFLHVGRNDSAAMARAHVVADQLSAQGVEVVEIRVVRRSVRRDLVRFYHDADRAFVGRLMEAMRGVSSGDGREPRASQFRRFRGETPKPGTMELWLS